MGLLFWNNVPYEIIDRDQPYYGRFTMCIKFQIPHASALRVLNHDKIDRLIEIRKDLNEKLRSPQPGSWAYISRAAPINDQDATLLHSMCDFLLQHTDKFRQMIYGNSLSVYTNSPEFVQLTTELSFVTPVLIQQLRITGQPGTLKLKRSTSAYRCYFKHQKCTESIAQTIANFVKAQDNIKPSPAFQRWIDQGFTRLQDHLFFDCNDNSIPFLLDLISPGIIRKILPIVR